jgi:hypothetical protein
LTLVPAAIVSNCSISPTTSNVKPDSVSEDVIDRQTNAPLQPRRRMIAPAAVGCGC